MKNWYAKIVDKVSYRIDHKKIRLFLTERKKEYINCLSDTDLDPKLRQLLNIIDEPFREENKKWIEENATANDSLEKTTYNLLFSPVSLNQMRHVNDFLIKQNFLLKEGGHFVCWFESSTQRKAAIYKRFPLIIAQIIYFFDLLWHRACPKLPWVKKMYFAVTRGKRRVYPTTEVLGRLYCCGFGVICEQYIQNRDYVIARKINEPFNNSHPSYGPLVRLPRIGQNGTYFNVYKFRTMHAYSEYLQAYIYEHNKLAEGGKFANDFRIPKWGKFMRKYWLDEIPMIINLLKGDIKLIGVRPLSQQYYNLYSLELQQLRIQTQPGLLPPYYADLPNTLEEIEISETIYLEKYLRHPFKTDCEYFFMILYNILIKRKRSS